MLDGIVYGACTHKIWHGVHNQILQLEIIRKTTFKYLTQSHKVRQTHKWFDLDLTLKFDDCVNA
jgi:hypothetical protein